MNNQQTLLSKLKEHSVRLQAQNGTTIGTGFLYVPPHGSYAYILTAAHVLKNTDTTTYPLTAQCYIGAKNHAPNEGKLIFHESDVLFHASYRPEKIFHEVQSTDTALISVPKENWMSPSQDVCFGTAHENLPVIAVSYSGATSKTNILTDSNFLHSVLTNVDSQHHQMTTTLDGELKIHLGDSAFEIGGMSGTIYAADEQESIILIGMFCDTLPNAVFQRAYLIDLSTAKQLLNEVGVFLPEKEIHIPPRPRQAAPYHVISKTLVAESRFVHRNHELSQIQHVLTDNKISILSGIGGIGKSELARTYALRHESEYSSIQFISCTESILEGFSAISIEGLERQQTNGIWESNSAFGQRILEWFQAHDDYSCLFLLDDVSRDDPAWEIAASLPQHKIVTTRWGKSAWQSPCIEVKPLSDVKEQQQLFEAYLERELEDDEYPFFKKIADLTAGHTLTLQLIALQCLASEFTLEEILAQLQQNSVYTEDPNHFSYGRSLVETNMYQHIRAIWNLANFSDCERSIMEGLSLLPSSGAVKKEYQAWLQLNTFNEIHSLTKQGWIQPHRNNGTNYISLHMVIAEVVYRELYLKNSTDLSSMFSAILTKVKNRTLSYHSKRQYFQYGVQISQRIRPSKYAIHFIQKVSEEAEFLHECALGLDLLKRSESIIQRLNLNFTIIEANNYSDMALLYQRMYDMPNMFLYFKKARQGYARLKRQYPKHYALHCHNEARAYLMSRNYMEARKLEQTAEPLLKIYGRDQLGKVYDVLADCCAIQMQDFTAKAQSQNLSPEALGQIQLQLLQNEQSYWNLAVQTKEKETPCDLQEIMVSKRGVALTNAFLGNSTEAIKTIHEVLEFYQRTTGEESEQTADTYSDLCTIYEKADRLQESASFGEKAIQIMKRLSKNGYYNLEVIYHNTIFVYERLGDSEKVREYTQEFENWRLSYKIH